jgi:formylglycine-generating enzyme required for sulfatase activity
VVNIWEDQQVIGKVMILSAFLSLGIGLTFIGADAADSSSSARPLTSAEEQKLQPKDEFQECANCPRMVVVPAGSFMMGSPEGEDGHQSDESPQHNVMIGQPFAVGKFAVTFAEWDACVADGGCGGYKPKDEGWGRGNLPVINVSWDDAKAYTAWLSKKTGKTYRLPSEAKREYVARADTKTRYWWGDSISHDQANYFGGGSKTVPVESFQPNPWGLYQVHGNVGEWVEDCYHDKYIGAFTDGSAWTTEGCSLRVLRGGSWSLDPQDLRAAFRYGSRPDLRLIDVGFRVSRTSPH